MHRILCLERCNRVSDRVELALKDHGFERAPRSILPHIDVFTGKLAPLSVRFQIAIDKAQCIWHEDHVEVPEDPLVQAEVWSLHDREEPSRGVHVILTKLMPLSEVENQLNPIVSAVKLYFAFVEFLYASGVELPPEGFDFDVS
jgi:hypothetical protein